MNTNNFSIYVVISISLFSALLLTIWPLPGSMNWLRPAWVILVLLYWSITLPQCVGLWWAWLLGLFLDGLHGALLGEHALACLIVVYLASHIRRQLIVTTAWLQILIIFLLMLVYQLVIFISQGFAGQMITAWYYWLASLSSALVWPILTMLLRSYRQRFKIY